MRALFVATLFVSAYLLFLVQPMVVRSILPLLGGGPGVWNTCMVFFQGALLAGYLYAHLLASRLGLRAQLACHAAALLGIAALSLPIGLPDWTPVGEESAAKWALILAAVSVGAPFFMLAATGPLLQSWFTRTSHAAAANPYPLYAASNAGSLLALLGYPLFIEPHLSLSAQRGVWSWAYAGFAALVIGCGLLSMRRPAPASRAEPQAAPVTNRARLHWLLYALVPSSLVLATTQHLTSNIAAVPLLWVVPLAIYLGTFVIAFSGRFGERAARLCNLALPAVAVAVAVLVLRETITPIGPILGAHLLLLALGATVCHARLFAERPVSARLTEFYLWIGLGGVLGGVLNAFVLPHLFTNITEYPLAVALTCWLRPGAAPGRPALKNWPGLALAAGVVAAWFLFGAQDQPALQWAVPAALCLAAYRLPAAFAVAVAALLLLLPVAEAKLVKRQLHAERTFFGVHRVYAVEQGDSDWHELWDGRTLHGKQYWRGALNFEPTTYYTESGPVGDVMGLVASRPKPLRRAGLVGLGAGTLAAYGRPGQEFTFFEIDPSVVRIAQDPALFTYLRHSKAAVRIVTGDARVKLKAEPDGGFDLLVLDAFSSDAIPVHLLTREAMELYISKLSPDGVLALHVTNWYLDLVPVVANITSELGLAAAIRPDTELTDEDHLMGKYISVWITVARTRAELAPLGPDWYPLKAVPWLRTWTDDYSDLMSVFRW